MKYLCLIYDEEKKMSALPKTEQQQLMSRLLRLHGGCP